MEFTQVEILIQKMSASVSDEVRQRAFSTIITKIQCKLLDLDDLCMRSPDVSATLLYWMQDFYHTSLLEKSLWLLVEMTKRPSTLKRLRQSSAPTQFLCELREWILQSKLNPEHLVYVDAALKCIVDKEVGSGGGVLSETVLMSKQTTRQNKENERSLSNTISIEVDSSVKVEVKPKANLLDYVFLPTMRLSESDEKLLFDVQVQLKFGNQQTLTSTLRDQMMLVVKDFPIEILKTRFEIVDSLLSLLQNGEYNVCYYAGQVLKKIVRGIHKRIQLCHNEQYCNAYTKRDNEARDHLLQTYPTLDTRYSKPDAKFKESYIASTVNQKTLKQMLECIVVGLLRGEARSSKFPGLRVSIFAHALQLMRCLVDEVGGARDAAHDTIMCMLKALAIFFDRFETPLKEAHCLPLLLIAVELFALLPEELCVDMNRVVHHLAQTQFSNILSAEQSHSLLIRLASISDTQVMVVQHNRLQQIITSLNAHWESRSSVNRELICLSVPELHHSISLLGKLVLSVPTIENKSFMNHYVMACLYCIQMQTDRGQAEDNLVQIMYVPNKDAQILIYSALIHCLSSSSTQHLKLPTQTTHKPQSIRSLCIQLLQSEKLICHMFQNSLLNPEIYKMMLEILCSLLQSGQAPAVIYTFTNVIACSRGGELVLNLMAQGNPKSNFQRQLVNLFSRDAKQRQQSTSMLSSRQYCQQVFDHDDVDGVERNPLHSEYASAGDYLDGFLDEEGKLRYCDNTADLLQGVMLRRHTNSVMVWGGECSMEQISNLEGLATSKDLEYALRSGAIEQLCGLYLQYCEDESSFSKAFGVRPSQLRAYWQDVIASIVQVLEHQQSVVTRGVQHNYLAFISKIFNLLTCYLIFSVGEDTMRQSLTSCHAYLNKRPIVIECALNHLRNSQLEGAIKFCLLRFLYASVFRAYYPSFPGIACQRGDAFIPLCPMLQVSEPAEVQQWKLYYPLSSNAEWYISQFVECLSKGTQPTDMRTRMLLDTNLESQLDWVVGLQSLNINITVDDLMTTQLEQLILSPTFLGSPQMYLLALVAKLESNCLPKLQKLVIQMLSESQGQDLVELSALYMQLCLSNKNKIVLPFDLLTLLQQYPYHAKAAQLTIKLVGAKLLQPSLELLHYLRNHFLTVHEQQFTQSHLPLTFLRVTLGSDLMQKLEPVDQNICFAQLMQFCSSPITKIRSLALNHLHNHLPHLNDQQQSRLTDECMNVLFGKSEAQIIYSQAMQIITELLHQEADGVMSQLTNRKVVTHCQDMLVLEGNSTLFKGAILNLIATLLSSSPKEYTPIIHNSNILSLMGKLLPTCWKKMKHLNQCNEVCLCIDAASQIYVLLMKQSVTTTMQLLQTHNVVQLFTTSLHKFKNLLQRNLPYSDYVLEQAVVNVCKVMQISCLMQPDLVCVDLRACKRKVFASLITLLQNEGFAGSTKIQMAFTLTCIVHTGYNDQDQGNGELIYTLNQVYNESADTDKYTVIQTISALVSSLTFAKIALLQTGLSETVANSLSKELDTYIYSNGLNQSKTSTNTKKSNKSMTQSFAMNNQGYNNNQCIKMGVLFLKLLYAQADDESTINTKSIAQTVGTTIDILHKLLLLSSKHQLAMDHYKQLLTNLATNSQLQVIFVQKITENKQQIIHDLTKQIKLESITPDLFDAALRCLSVLGMNSEFRLIFSRLRIIEEMTEKLYQIWEKKRTWQPTNQRAQSITSFLCVVSFYKDAQPKILHSSKILTLFIDLLRDHGPQAIICQDILLILLNSALKLKLPFLTQEGLPGLILYYISEEKVSPETRLQSSQLLINLLYKSTQAISLFNKIEVIEELEIVMKQAQRQADRYDLTQGTLNSQKDESIQLRKIFQSFTNNLNQIIKILRIEW